MMALTVEKPTQISRRCGSGGAAFLFQPKSQIRPSARHRYQPMRCRDAAGRRARGTDCRVFCCAHMEGARASITEGLPFGSVDGRPARLYTLQNEKLRARITDYGGILVSLELLAAGRSDHVVLGFDDVAGYTANKGSFGALLGRNANRIAGGSFSVDGRTYSLSTGRGRSRSPALLCA